METISLTNHVATATLLTFIGAEQAAWPVTHLQRPEEPLLTWRSTAATQHWMIYDFGSVKTVGLMGLVNANFTRADFWLDDDPAMGSPVSARYITGRACPTGRYQIGGVWPSSPSARYFMLGIPAQSTTDGTSAFSCGGLWAGPATDCPVGLGYQPTWEIHEPALDVRGVGNSAVSRLAVAAPYLSLTVRRFGDVGQADGVDDEWGAWTALDASLRSAGIFALHLNYGNPAHFWVMRRMSPPRWSFQNYPQGEDQVTFEEVIYP